MNFVVVRIFSLCFWPLVYQKRKHLIGVACIFLCSDMQRFQILIGLILISLQIFDYDKHKMYTFI